jgi:hypothetical protein
MCDDDIGHIFSDSCNIELSDADILFTPLKI